MSGSSPLITGAIALPTDTNARWAVLCELAGVLAEHAVQSLEVQDPRACRSWTLSARTSDLPRAMLEAAPGTTFVAPAYGVTIMLAEQHVSWSASPHMATSLARLSSASIA